MRMIYCLAMVIAFSLSAVAKTPVKAKSIPEIKQALEMEKNTEKRYYLLSDLVKKYASTNLTGELADDAKKSADALLASNEKFKKNWNYGNAIHHSHLVLGRLSLMAGKVEEAMKELKLAGQTPGSPQLDSFGPNMTLAKELLEKGEKAAVLEYFEDCTRFWKTEFATPTIADWKAAIAQGKAPDFKANLVY